MIGIGIIIGCVGGIIAAAVLPKKTGNTTRLKRLSDHYNWMAGYTED